MNKIFTLCMILVSLSNAKDLRILVYGDSNTYGLRADFSFMRYEIKDTWSEIMADELGDDYAVITEGLNGRTVNLNNTSKVSKDNKINAKLYSNGTMLLPSILASHTPLDLLIIMLGTNDLGEHDAKQIAKDLGKLIDIAKLERFNIPNVLLIAPPKLNIGRKGGDILLSRSTDLPALLSKICEQKDAYFYNAQEVVEFAHWQDKLHFSKDDHHALGKAVAKQVQKIFEN